jgi:hypothetical protein
MTETVGYPPYPEFRDGYPLPAGDVPPSTAPATHHPGGAWRVTKTAVAAGWVVAVERPGRPPEAALFYHEPAADAAYDRHERAAGLFEALADAAAGLLPTGFDPAGGLTGVAAAADARADAGDVPR